MTTTYTTPVAVHTSTNDARPAYYLPRLNVTENGVTRTYTLGQKHYALYDVLAVAFYLHDEGEPYFASRTLTAMRTGKANGMNRDDMIDAIDPDVVGRLWDYCLTADDTDNSDRAQEIARITNTDLTGDSNYVIIDEMDVVTVASAVLGFLGLLRNW